MQILTTKLHVPTPRNTLIHRTRLIHQLNRGLHRKLTVISAPAGFGKTTLVSDWMTHCARPVAWLSLDTSDSDPIRFLTYMLKAIQTIDEHIGQSVLDALKSAQQPAIESLVIPLLNDIATTPKPFLLVLDDYHLVESSIIDDALTFLLNQLPPQLHLVIATREDPQLPLARLRVRDELTELRVADLRFTVDEATDFLNQVMGAKLSSVDIEALEQRTEGWIAGLQLAAISMQGRSDVSAFIHAFQGNNRFVLDYLIDEVLHQQPEKSRQFLLQTSILDRLNGALCDAVTQQTDSQNMLEKLESGNLFVIPLDDKRQWYRYHHLFADALRLYLQNEHPDLVGDLHRRACDWYVQHDRIHEAIRHALVSEDYERASDLIERMWQTLDSSYQTATWSAWVKQLPERIVLNRPLLCAGYGSACLSIGELEASEMWFQRAEHWLDASIDQRQQMRISDDEQFTMLPASIHSARAYRSLAFADIPKTLYHAQQALKIVGESDHPSRTQSITLLGIAYWASGELIEADEILSAFIAEMREVGRITDALEVTFLVADIRVTRGQLYAAYRMYDQAFKLLTQLGNPVLIGVEDLYRGVSDLYREWNQLDKAEDHLLAAEDLSEQLIIRPDWYHRLYISWARLKITQGELEIASELLDRAQDHYVRTPLPMLRSADAIQARIWILQGELDQVQDWVHQQGLPTKDGITYQNEFAHITLARLYLAQFRRHRTHDNHQTALQLLHRLQESAESGNRNGSLIEILMLQALLYYADGDIPTALAGLKSALLLAEPEGYIRLFIDEGTPMQNLFNDVLTQGDSSDYIDRLLSAFDEATPQIPKQVSLLDPLSERELEVLQLLTTDLTGPEIARELMVSLSTMRTHTRSIYSKLDVNSRRIAVRRAHELGLL